MLTKEQRLEDYYKALTWLESHEKSIGICFILGGIRWERNLRAPFIGWKDCWKYYPEFTGMELPIGKLYEFFGNPKNSADAGTEYIRQVRIEYIKAAITLIESQSTPGTTQQA